jgi:tryptophanyl-tRNA synthetase
MQNATNTEPATTLKGDGSDQAQQFVDPWHVEAGPEGINYDKLIKDFGSELITPDLIDRIEKLTRRPAHPWLRRGHFFSHR